MIPQDTLRELTQLRDRVAYLEAALDLLRDTNNKRIELLVKGLGVTVGQARTLYAMTKGILTREQAVGLDLHRVSDCDYRSLDSLIKHLRHRPGLEWLKISTIYGLGYTIDDPASLKRIRAVLEAHQ